MDSQSRTPFMTSEPTLSSEERLDPAVVAALYVEHAEELHRFLLGFLRDPDAAREVLQATFAKAMEGGHKSREETRKGWLFTVAYHEAREIRRKQTADKKAIRGFAWMRASGLRAFGQRASGECPSDERSPGAQQSVSPPVDEVIRWETVESVRLALGELPDAQRRIVQMRIYEDKTFAVIAQELEVPLGTVLTRMQLALKKLRKSLDTDGSVNTRE